MRIQEFIIVPYTKNFKEGIRAVSEIYSILKIQIKTKYGKQFTNIGDEGGFAPPLERAEDALELLEGAIEQGGYKGTVKIALDPAASEFYSNGKYTTHKEMSEAELLDYYLELIKNFDIISLEDMFDQDSFKGFAAITKAIGSKVDIVGDDLLVTNKKRIQKAIDMKACNSLLLKCNQIGSVTESIDAHNLVKKAGWNTMVSHRSGDTEDSFIADLAVGLGCGRIKTGAPARSERTAKYNRLLVIESESKAIYG